MDVSRDGLVAVANPLGQHDRRDGDGTYVSGRRILLLRSPRDVSST